MKNRLRWLAFLPLLASACVTPQDSSANLHRQLSLARAECDRKTEGLDAEIRRLQEALAGEKLRAEKASSEETARLRSEMSDLENRHAELSREAESLRAVSAEAEAARERARAAETQLGEIREKLQLFLDPENVGVDATPLGVRITVRETILFDAGKPDLKGEAAGLLEKLASILAKTKAREIRIAGHSDNKPIRTRDFPSNWELSTARALAVLHRLVDRHGLDPSRLVALGYGAQQPVAGNETPEGRAKNRRVEIFIVPEL